MVEDEEPLARLVARYLERAEFGVEVVGDGFAALDRVREMPPDVLVLDLGLPGLDGMEVCRRVRALSDCYIIILTARAEEPDRLRGLSLGADDYVTKPFSVRELVARVQVLLRRPSAGVRRVAAPLVLGDLRIDPVGREVRLGIEDIELTPTEFDLLLTLASEPAVVFSRPRLIELVWGPGWIGDDRLVDVHIRNLRRKLGDDSSGPLFIRTVRGAGYRIGAGR